MKCIGMYFKLSFSYREKSLSQPKCFILKTPVSINREKFCGVHNVDKPFNDNNS